MSGTEAASSDCAIICLYVKGTPIAWGTGALDGPGP